MGVLSNTLNVTGLILLIHAVYSAYEVSLLPSTGPEPLSTTAPTTAPGLNAPIEPKTTLPLDVTIETLFSVFLLCLGIVLGAPDLKPIQWRVWAGKIEKEKQKPLKNLDDGFGGNPYLALEQRAGFLDIRAERKSFAEWVKDGQS
ncbi:Exocyst complex component sec10 [Sphaceloma murrayae]|uniref:Exocyst complex component sec10 n=1 Tax=Sphaceloma murrayae TaxID=2082308 RepID=A0A2K1QVM8_9PEZI|nr:Exocyst complex component sec10 [Sphaceloma murrayae]